MRYSAESQVSPILLLIIERLRKILAHQLYFQSERVGAYLDLCRMPLYLINAPLPRNANKAAPRIASDIILAFRPDDNHRLIVHEYSGIEPGDAQGLRTVRDFITNRTDPKRAPAERLHAIW